MTTRAHFELAAMLAQAQITIHFDAFSDPEAHNSPQQVATDCMRLIDIAEDIEFPFSATPERVHQERATEILKPYGLTAVVSAEGITIEGILI